MALQNVESEHTGIKRWIVLIVGLGLALSYSILQTTIPQFPYHHSESLIYPLLPIAQNWVLQFAIYILITAIVILGIVRASITARWLMIFVGLLVSVSCGLIVISFGSSLFAPGFTHIDSTRYEQTVYHLGFSYGAERGFDYNLYIYIVYKCDDLGLICTNVDTPYDETNLTAEMPEHDVSFVQQSSDGRLYVQVDGDLYPVSTNNPP